MTRPYNASLHLISQWMLKHLSPSPAATVEELHGTTITTLSVTKDSLRLDTMQKYKHAMKAMAQTPTDYIAWISDWHQAMRTCRTCSFRKQQLVSQLCSISESAGLIYYIWVVASLLIFDFVCQSTIKWSAPLLLSPMLPMSTALDGTEAGRSRCPSLERAPGRAAAGGTGRPSSSGPDCCAPDRRG